MRNFAAKQDGKRQGGGVCSRLFCGKRGNDLADVFLPYQILITLLLRVPSAVVVAVIRRTKHCDCIAFVIS